MSTLTEVWGGSKSEMADKVRRYADRTGKIHSYIMLALLHEAVIEIEELERAQASEPAIDGFTEWMAERMEEKGVGRKELASMAGLSETSIHNIMSGKNSPTLRSAGKIAEVLR